MVNSVETLKNFTSSNLCAKYYIKSKPRKSILLTIVIIISFVRFKKLAFLH